MGLEADVKWLERASTVDPFGSHLHVSAVACKLPSRVAQRRNTSFLIDATTPHGDVLVNENRAIKPATGWVTVHALEPITQGVHEWSIKIENQGETSDGSGLMLGVVPKSFCRYDSFISQGGGWCLSRAGKFYGQWKRVEGVGSANPLVFCTGDTVLFELDMEAARLTVTVGDRFVVGEVSKLTPEVFPAVSLHYRQQHVYFESRRVKVRQPTEGGWFQRSLHQSCDIVCHLTREHLAARVTQLLAMGTDRRFEAAEPSKWQAFVKLREEVVAGVCAGVEKLAGAPQGLCGVYATDVLARRARRGGAVAERVAECGLELCLSLLSAVSAGNPAVSDAAFDLLSAQFERQPLFSLSPDAPPGAALLPTQALVNLRDAAAAQPTPAALRLLVVLAVLRGEATECLRVVSLLLATKAPEARLQVGSLLGRLGRRPATYGLPFLAFSDDTERVEVRAAIRRAAPEAWGGDKKGEKWSVHSVASDGDSLYLATGEGLVKMGCGKGAVPTEITRRNAEGFPPGMPVALAFVGGSLYCRPSAAYAAGAKLPPGHDLLLIDTETLEVTGHVSADGCGSIDTCDNRDTPLPLGGDAVAALPASPDGEQTAPPPPPPPPPTAQRAVESRILTDGTYLYLVSGRAHPVLRDDLGLSFPPTAPQQCRSGPHQAVTVTTFDPAAGMRPVRSVVLTGPRPSALGEAAEGAGGVAGGVAGGAGGGRRALQLCKDTYVDFGPPAEALSSATGHVTVEMWLKPGPPDESKNVYVHGDKAAGGEVFIDIHSLDNGWYVKGGARV
eukprot:Rhum_TRINITY_DN9658_c1_g1::Rhum_TRINITY_DN9658_c1_g1_i1::g.34578::m.34578